MSEKLIFTIGHSTRALDEFITILKTYEIKTVIDIRTIPKSRHNPQYNENNLKESLNKFHIGYKHLKDLGGLRHPVKNSINTGWLNASFRGFADYMQTLDFQKGLEKLEKIALKKRCVLLCAEAIPWRCHRSLVSDALTAHEWTVIHILSKTSSKKHQYTAFLKIDQGRLFYPSNN